jgi:transcriptional regulator NrdR family protein
METQIKKPAKLEVVRYSFEFIEGNPKIIIHQIKVLDKNNKYIKFASLEKAFKHLKDYPITFKNIFDGNTNKI